jgi:AraC-like DNA-binding protein
MTQKPTVSISLIHTLLQYAASRKIDPVMVCKSINFPLEKFNDPEMRISVGTFYALWSRIADQAEDPDFGLHVAEPFRSQFGRDVLGAVMLNCPTVGSAMEKLIRYHDLSTDVVKVKLIHEENRGLYAWESALGDGFRDRQISEAIVCRIFFTLQMLSNGKMPFTEIRFQHTEPERITEHRRIFACPVIFNQSYDAVVIQSDGLNLRLPMANPKILAKLETIIQGQLESLYGDNTWAEGVSQKISKMLLDGRKPAIGLIAQELAISTRHLQNKLKSEGVTYRTLLDQIRERMAIQYLKDSDMNILDTAFLLGFSDQSSFNHAFKRWTGKTPREFREH